MFYLNVFQDCQTMEQYEFVTKGTSQPGLLTLTARLHHDNPDLVLIGQSCDPVEFDLVHEIVNDQIAAKMALALCYRDSGGTLEGYGQFMELDTTNPHCKSRFKAAKAASEEYSKIETEYLRASYLGLEESITKKGKPVIESVNNNE